MRASLACGKRGVCAIGVVVVVVVVAAAVLAVPVPAMAQSPWWRLNGVSSPSNLQPGLAKQDVQELTVSATEGLFVLAKDAPRFEYRLFRFEATAKEVEEGLEELYGAGNAQVGRGPANSEGIEPYVITFIGKLAYTAVEPIDAAFSTGFLSGGKKEATVSVLSEGRPDGVLTFFASNLGDANASGASTPVTITAKLPAGLKALNIEALAGESNGFDASPLGPVACSLGSLTCTFAGNVLLYDQIQMEIPVIVEKGATFGEASSVSVFGGGAPAATLTRPVAISGTPAPFGVESYELTPEEEGGRIDTQAGSHPFQLTTTLMLNQTAGGGAVAPVKDLHFKLPPGLIGNPTPFPQCTLARFLELNYEGGVEKNGCPQQTVVGVAKVLLVVKGVNGSRPFLIASPLFSLEPNVGEPARFGFITGVGTPVMLDTAVRTGGDYGVTVSVDNISQQAVLLGSQVTLWGVPGDPRHDSARGYQCLNASREEERFRLEGRESELSQFAPCPALAQHLPPPLLEMPTSCTGPLSTTVEADSWVQPDASSSLTGEIPLPGLDGCNALPFAPSIKVTPDAQDGSTPTGLTVTEHVPQEVSLSPTGLAEAEVKDTTVTLPEGVALNPAAADGLLSCSTSQIGLEDAVAPVCPEASKVGTVTIKTPLLPNPLEGAAYLAAQDANPFGSLVALYIVAEDPVAGVLVKVAGKVIPDRVTGQLVSTFENTPQVPFEDLKLHFFGGDRAPLTTPAVCGAYTTTAAITPWSENPPATPSSTFDITSGPNGSACSNPLPFAPSLAAGTSSIQAGGFSPFTTTFSRPDGQQDLRGLQLHMPSGLLGIVSSVKPCEEAQANAGTCGPESLIGHTIVSVGVGGDPYSVRGGEVFLTGPYEGAPYGLSIVNPAKAGPFDLGKVIVRAKIEVDPLTANLTVTTDSTGPYAVPHILDGIPLQIQHINVAIDRPGFIFNPTDCDPLAVTGSLESDQGATSALSVPFQVTNCAILGFKPKLTTTTSGKASRKNGTSLQIKLAYPKGAIGKEAWFKSAKFAFPKQLPARLTTLQQACAAATFNANPAACPPAARVGTAVVHTPVLPGALTGAVYFVSYGGAKFPEAVIVLQGDNVTVDLHAETFISKTGVTSATLRTIPGVPFESVEVVLPSGPFSEFAANGNLCTTHPKMSTAFTAQNGLAIHQSTALKVTGCPKGKGKGAKAKGKHRQ